MRGRRTHLRAWLCAVLLMGGGLNGGAPAAWAQSGGTSLDDLGKELTRLQQDVQRRIAEIEGVWPRPSSPSRATPTRASCGRTSFDPPD